ncbi:hypothetical protein [Massilia mucilaginosa]|uniref:hypothetical protein n=1 Tax=Massilia mucilaginosa TaxID=2609282 RepID=UPI001423C1EC|nr:hypothetical protein [Massilia mucilaginosa]
MKNKHFIGAVCLTIVATMTSWAFMFDTSSNIGSGRGGGSSWSSGGGSYGGGSGGGHK